MNGRDLGLLFGGFAIGVATGLLFKKKEESTKEESEKEPDVAFEVKDSDTPVKISAHDARLLRSTYMRSLIAELEQKIAKETEDGNKPYSKENPPSPMTEEQMRVCIELTKKSLYKPLLSEEKLALKSLKEHEELIFKYNREELVKELNEDYKFVINDILTAPPDYLENQAKWEAHIADVMTKFRTKLENRKEPYSVENPPAPFTEEEMQVYARLKNRVGNVQTSNEECAAFLILNEHMNLLNMYKNVL